MADVLLTHSYHLPYDRKQVRKMQPYPPLGTLYAASLLREHGIEVALFDAMLEDPETGFRKSLERYKPRIVAIYEDDFNFLTKMCLTRMRELAFHMIDLSRGAGARVIVHGSDATDRKVEYIDRGADFVLVGESEYSLLEIAQSLLEGRELPVVPGVIRAGSDGQPETVAPAISSSNRQWKSLPLPARDLIDFSAYRAAWKSHHGVFSQNIIASRGCPFRCNWCAKPIFGDSYYLRAPEEVAEEMRLLKKEYGAEHLWFADDIFALNRHWIREFADAVERRHCAIPFKIQARADLLSEETSRALKRAGCSEVWMGVESGSQKVLDAMDKSLRVEQVIAARHHLGEQGILACYFLQFGYPGEGWPEIQQTVNLVRETRPDDIGVSLSYPLPHTAFYERVRQELGAKTNWSDSEDLCVMFKGAYSDVFYRAVRDALHAEVESWKAKSANGDAALRCSGMWDNLLKMEATSRNVNPTRISPPSKLGERHSVPPASSFVELRSWSADAREN